MAVFYLFFICYCRNWRGAAADHRIANAAGACAKSSCRRGPRFHRSREEGRDASSTFWNPRTPPTNSLSFSHTIENVVYNIAFTPLRGWRIINRGNPNEAVKNLLVKSICPNWLLPAVVKSQKIVLFHHKGDGDDESSLPN